MQDKANEGGEGPQGSKGSRLAQHALIMAGGTLASRTLGLTRDIILLNSFGRTVTDAWLVAFRLPNFFRRLLGEGSLANSFVPIYVELGLSSRDEADQLASSIYTLLLSVLCVAVTLGVLFTESIISFWISGEGYLSIEGKLQLTIDMARVMFLFLFAISHFAFFMAILNAKKKFAAAALAPCGFNIAVIVAALLPFSEMALAWGVVAGGVLQASVLIPELIRSRVRLRLEVKWSPAVSKVLGNMLPGMVGMGIVQLTALVNAALTSHFAEGSHTWIYSADRILEFPLSIISVSLGTALLPTLSEKWSLQDREGFRKTLAESIGLNLYLAVPAAIGIWFMAEGLVTLMYSWSGSFSDEDIRNTAMILRAYGPLLVLASLIRVIAPAFYARKNTWLPAFISAAALSLHLFLAPLMMTSFGLVGLVYSVCITALCNLLALSISLRFFSIPTPFSQVGGSLLKMLPSFVWVVGLCSLWKMTAVDSKALEKLVTFGSVCFIFVAYIGFGYFTGVDFSKRLVGRIFRR